MTKVRVNARKKERDRQNALGDNILRYITELVTNSDDSYKRLESKNIEHDSLIYIKLEKERRNEGFVLSVTDHAEGMSLERLNEVFLDYAGDNANGDESGARGIFGQGASDVLQAAAEERKTAMIESIKDDVASRLKYNIDEDQDGDIDVKEIPAQGSQLKQLRKNLNIPGNGTKLSFGIPSRVKFNKRIIDNLAESIEKIPSLRYLLNREDRKVIYSYEGKERLLSSRKYQFQEDNLISKQPFKMVFEDKTYNCTLALYRNENKKDDGTDIIVRDENYTVFDNTMFDFKNTLAAQNLSGELIIPNLYELCKEHLNRDGVKDAIVFDNRTGFDTRNPFYKTLNNVIYPILEEIIKKQVDDNKSTNLTNNKRISDALKKLNKYLKNELKDTINGPGAVKKEPPAEGIKFARGSITVTKDKKYDLKLYINSSMIAIDETIDITCDDDEFINVSPLKINYSSEEIENGLVVKNVTIQGLKLTNDSVKIQAKVGTRISNVLVDVIEEDIHYPENGMEFYPSNISLVVDKPHVCKLYVDTEIIPIESIINITCEGLEIDNNTISIEQDSLLNDNIACIDIITNGGIVGNQYDVIASAMDKQCISKITIIEPNQNDKNSGGFISDIKTDVLKMAAQSFIDLSTRILYINSANPINLRIITDIDNLDPENPKFNKEQTKYLCDILATQAARYLVIEQANHGDIDIEDPDDATAQILDLIQQHKNKIYVDIYPSMMGIATEKED